MSMTNQQYDVSRVIEWLKKNWVWIVIVLVVVVVLRGKRRRIIIE